MPLWWCPSHFCVALDDWHWTLLVHELPSSTSRMSVDRGDQLDQGALCCCCTSIRVGVEKDLDCEALPSKSAEKLFRKHKESEDFTWIGTFVLFCCNMSIVCSFPSNWMGIPNSYQTDRSRMICVCISKTTSSRNMWNATIRHSLLFTCVAFKSSVTLCSLHVF